MSRASASPLDRAIVAVALVVIGLFLIWVALPHPGAPAPPGRPPAARDAATTGYLFCTWNVENFYDDNDNPRFADDEEDTFGRHPELVREKVRLLADALLLQGDGRGPDILAMVEVESLRCVELLRDALNERLSPDAHYTGILFRENRTGRRNAPALLTRLKVDDSLTRTFGIRRILEGHIEADGAPLVILASHWTSRLRGDTESKREAYADVLYARVEQLCRVDPAADVLLSGDYNDEPDDPSLRDHLHVTADPRLVQPGLRPLLWDLMAGRDPRTDGTYFLNGRWEILDHIVASPGLLDPTGWQVVPETLEVDRDPRLLAAKDRRPRRFGNAANANPRGPSDHLAISVRLRVGALRVAHKSP